MLIQTGVGPPSYAQYLTRDYAAVRCRLTTRPVQFVLDPSEDSPVFAVKAGEPVVEISHDIKVVTQDGEAIQPEGRFFRTVRTINPYHAILDISDFSALR